MAPGSVDERRLPVRKRLRRTEGERASGGGGRLRLGTPDPDLRIQRLDRAADAGDEPAAADGRDDGDRIGRIFQDLESHRAMAGDEIVIVERVYERSFDSGKRALAQGLPGDLVRHRDEPCAERLHTLDLRGRRRLD